MAENRGKQRFIAEKSRDNEKQEVRARSHVEETETKQEKRKEKKRIDPSSDKHLGGIPESL